MQRLSIMIGWTKFNITSHKKLLIFEIYCTENGDVETMLNAKSSQGGSIQLLQWHNYLIFINNNNYTFTVSLYFFFCGTVYFTQH